MKYLVPLFLIVLVFPLCGVEEGYASWYGGKFNGRLTANGEVYDMNKLTAAHKTLPFGTLVKVTNYNNEKQIVVRINDRGPFVEGRIIDLSRAAAEKIGMVGDGVVRVRVEILESPGLAQPDEGLYALQVAAYRVEGNADLAREKLVKSGHRVVLQPASGGLIRVFVTEVHYDALEEVKKSLAELGFKETLIRKMATL